MSSANYKMNSLYALVAKASGAVAALMTTMVLTRTLHEADFGSYVFAYTVVFTGGILGTLGMGNAVLRFAGAFLGAGQARSARQVTVRCVSIGLAGLVVLALLVIALHPLANRVFSAWPPGWVNAVLIALWLWGAGAILLITSALRAFGRIGSGAVAEITIPRFMLLATVAVLFLMKADNLSVMLCAAATVSILAATWSLFALMRAMPAGGDDDQPVSAGRVFGFALPLLGSHVLFQLMTDATLFFVATYCGREDVALYGAAYRIWGFLGLPQNAVSSAIQGRIAELHAVSDHRELEAVVRNSANMATLPTLLITLVVCVAAGPLLGTLFGEFYAGGHAALVVLCVAQLIFVVFGPCEHLLAMSGRQHTVLVITIASALVSVACAWMLTPSMGILGAAVAAGIATIAFKVLLAWQAWQQMSIRTWITFSFALDEQPSLAFSPASTAEPDNRNTG